MGRMKPAWYYERKATAATARAQYYANRQPPATGTAIQSRGAATDVFYRSLLQKFGTNPAVYRIAVDNDTLSKVTATEAGLKTTLASDEVPLRIRGSGVKPTRVHWFAGDPTPTVQRTAWNTKWVRYYSTAGDQSHYSVPFSKASGTVTPDDLQDAFDGLFGAGGSKRALLGAANGRAYLEFERAPVSATT
ncbi:hypothetical protein K9N68_10845 [Kovacikia minuta CCNUW1]|uniref:hypothetical protein n=1 Tax=Kovacikia minuta TaxID=2931930 RepID=UPI001CC90ACD|nr:hypothetical protein [Kovacikia minuta]UBF28326.1 hypothetical protein K9N68_10845 [Kovacikia minuta CCNUW1]